MSEDKWEANSIRLTLFPKDPLDLGGDYWRPVFGDEPEGEEIRPREGLKRQFGPWKGGVAEVHINPIRVDLFVGPASADPIVGQPMMPSIAIGPMSDCLNTFAAAMSPWLAKPPFTVARMAVSGTALVEGGSAQATYEILRRYIKSVDVRPGVMRDMFFRVNWPRKSEYVEYYNDLQTWASINYTIQAINAGQAPFFQVQQQHYAQLQFDVNTPGDRAEPLADGTIVPIFDDLLALVRQGITHGETPSDA